MNKSVHLLVVGIERSEGWVRYDVEEGRGTDGFRESFVLV
jgi:hypothetical protein